MSLFDKGDIMNKADKTNFKHALSKLLTKIVHVLLYNNKYVFDRGLLFHKVP